MSNPTDPPTPPSAPSSLEQDSIFPGGLKRYLVPGLFVLAVFVALFMRRPAPSVNHPVWSVQGRIFGTTYSVKVRPEKRIQLTQKALHTKIDEVLHHVDMKMSTYKKTSELSRFNQTRSTDPMQVSTDLLHVMMAAKKLHAMTKGAFDVTIGPIVNAWGFGPQKQLKQPKATVLAEAQKRVGMHRIQIDAKKKTIRKAHPRVYTDLSAIAKGFGVDAVSRMLLRLGFRHFLVEVGGEVRAQGHNARGVAWHIGIEKPRDGVRSVQLIVPLQNAAMATSGNYRNYIRVDGRRVSHLIDARTSEPVGHALASVTVVHASCMMADAWATALFVLGPKEGLALAKEKQLAVLFLVPKGTSFVRHSTAAFDALLRTKRKKTRK